MIGIRSFNLTCAFCPHKVLRIPFLTVLRPSGACRGRRPRTDPSPQAAASAVINHCATRAMVAGRLNARRASILSALPMRQRAPASPTWRWSSATNGGLACLRADKPDLAAELKAQSRGRAMALLPAILNVTAQSHVAPEGIRPRIVQEGIASVGWGDSIRHLLAQSFTRFIELRPGTVLIDLMKCISKETQALAVAAGKPRPSVKLNLRSPADGTCGESPATDCQQHACKPPWC